MNTLEKGRDFIKGNRIDFLDNLRTFMIFLVVLLHSGLVYESTGAAGFFWIVYDFSTNPVVDILNTIMDIFIMSTIFFISGYFTPLSLKSKSSWDFIKSKMKRLVAPWALAVLTLMPLYKIIFLASRGMPQQSWTSYFHFSNGIFSQSWLWFLPVLFLFDLVYLGLSRLNLKLPTISLKHAASAVFVLGLIHSIFMDMLNLEGWTKNALINFQNERLLIYFMLFLLGALGYKQRAFDSKLKNIKLFFAAICTVWIPVALYYHFYTNSRMIPRVFIFSEIADTILIWLNFHLSLAGLMFVLIYTFRFYLNKQCRFSAALSANSYNVYIIHTVLIGGIAFLMLNSGIPSLIKFVILTISAYATTNGLVSIYRKVFKSKFLVIN